MHSSAPYVDLYKLPRTGTETKAVGYGVLRSEIIRTKKKKKIEAIKAADLIKLLS